MAEVRETSRKPDEMYPLLERLSPGTRKLEIFARPHNVRPGWVSMGNQLGEQAPRGVMAEGWGWGACVGRKVGRGWFPCCRKSSLLQLQPCVSSVGTSITHPPAAALCVSRCAQMGRTSQTLRC